ncbi:RNA methyltransferase [Hydrotalea sp.]|uniref:TrmH family RNA methyltransferase n=1 Tax=Hydrotalea sp. TaxID=2881279 RepID=UPI0026309939|nr:RNA methyltransferase [Hydrotalea sp.]
MTPERKNKLWNVLNKRQPNLTVVMENVQDPHNISAVMRSCDAVGIQDIYIITTKIPRHKKFGAKSSSSAVKWLTIHTYDNVEECYRALRTQYQKIYTTHLAANAAHLYELNFVQNSIALVFGNEHEGVSEAARQLADGNFIIPQVGIIQSLNISVACAVSIYEAFRQKQLAGHYDKPALNISTMERLFAEWAPDAENN